MNLQPIDQIDPAQFEQLVFRFLWRFGFFNIERFGGSGDRGRDLVAETTESPLPGVTVLRKWVVQCKRYSNPLTKGALLEELASAAQHQADYYLLVGTFTMSSAQRDWLADVQPNYRFRILVVAADTLIRWFAAAPDISFDFERQVGPRPFTTAMGEMIAAVGGAANVSPPVLQVFSETLGEACAQGTADINTLHLLTAMANRADSNASRLLEASGATGKALKVITSITTPIRSHLDRAAVVISPNLRLALTLATDIARSRTESVGDLDLLAALLQMQDGGAVQTLVSLKVAVDRLRLTVGSATSSPTPSRYPGLPPEG